MTPHANYGRDRRGSVIFIARSTVVESYTAYGVTYRNNIACGGEFGGPLASDYRSRVDGAVTIYGDIKVPVEH